MRSQAFYHMPVPVKAEPFKGFDMIRDERHPVEYDGEKVYLHRLRDSQKRTLLPRMKENNKKCLAFSDENARCSKPFS